MEENDDAVLKKKEQLNTIALKLKKKFSGIDEEIDTVIRKIEIWWCYPEFLRRPTIINLWGMTGVGKTDLVRSLVSELDLLDKFCNIDMNNSQIDPLLSRKTIGSDFSILSRLYNYNIRPKDRAVLLLDEFQHFRTIDSAGLTRSGGMVKYDDLWKLLSDGRLGDDQFRVNFLRDAISDIVSAQIYEAQRLHKKEMKAAAAAAAAFNPPPGLEMMMDPSMIEGNGRRRSGVVNTYYLFKMISFSDEDIGRLAEFQYFAGETGLRDIINMANQYNSNPDFGEKVFDSAPYEIQKMILEEKLAEVLAGSKKDHDDTMVYSKILIFISGNMDQVFKADRSFDSMSDDEIYEITSKITLVDIKRELFKMFRPEQVSRLGNNHVIFHSLKHAHFFEVVQREIAKTVTSVKEEFDIDLTIDEELVWNAVQEIGIFAAQGVRPVLSSSAMILGELIPPYLVVAKECGLNELHITKMKE